MSSEPVPGDRCRRPTIYAVAKAAGVSIATVSRVLSTPDQVRVDTRERVLAAVADLDYVPHGAARSLAARSLDAYGLVVPEVRGPYYAELVTGFEAAASQWGAGVIVLLSDGKTDLDLAVLRLAGRVDGMVLMGAVSLEVDTRRAVSRKIPLIGLAATDLGGLETYSTESLSTALSLTTHLIDAHGRRSLLFVGSPQLSPDVAERYEGFVAAHRARGLEPAAPVEVPYKEEAGALVGREIAEGHIDADGVVCANDEVAVSLMRTVQAAGIDVPGDLSVTGWDDLMVAGYTTPGLTTARQPMRELGTMAAERLRDLLRDPTSEQPTCRLATTVVLRQSCGCPGNA